MNGFVFVVKEFLVDLQHSKPFDGEVSVSRITLTRQEECVRGRVDVTSKS